MERRTKNSGKVAIASMLAACTLGASPMLASGSTHSSSAHETTSPRSLQSGSTPSPSEPHKQRNPYTAINTAAARDPITVTPLRGGVYLLQGSGGNIGVLPGKGGALMVDAGVTVSRHKLEDTLKKLRASRVRYLVDTHWHFDHTGGNGWVHEHGAEIISTPNTLDNLSKTIRVNEWSHTFTPLPAAARPTVTVSSEKTLTVNGQSVRLRTYSPGHTDGDLSADFTRANVLFTGDTFWNNLYPFIDYEVGGSIDGMIRDANQNIAMVGGGTIVVPGHGPVGRRADLVEFRDMLVGIRARVADLKHKGLTVDQVIAAKPTKSFDAKWGQGLIGPDLFTKLVYRGV
ncbi:MBL fold metallo-hydrolase [Streptomyces sp. NPDC058459]|uniref:MBL fold metallo-hydrolase n=1 Tax=Streptomyces sp. NPDC058459 TaxID=3346508 RepID=UPI0036527E79